MRISDLIARVVTQSRAQVWLGVGLVGIGCVGILVTQLRLDSDVLNILPASFRSVQGLKIYDREFEQTRELTFALVCRPDEVDKLEGFAPVFAILAPSGRVTLRPGRADRRRAEPGGEELHLPPGHRVPGAGGLRPRQASAHRIPAARLRP